MQGEAGRFERDRAEVVVDRSAKKPSPWGGITTQGKANKGQKVQEGICCNGTGLGGA